MSPQEFNIMLYKDYLNTEDWKEKRKNKYQKQRRCAICASESNLNVHHLNYKDLVNVTNSDLRVLCQRCHYLTHDLYKRGKFKFRSDNHHSRFAIIKTAVKKELGLTGKNMFKF